MARTLTVKSGGGDAGKYNPGWHEVTVSNAKYGTWNDSKYLDIWFDGYPENLNMRVYEKIGKDGSEFAIGQVFRFANAGITGSLEGSDNTMVIKIDDTTEALKGSKLNIFMYKEGKYSRILKQTAPTAFKNDVESFEDNDVEYWKSRAESYYNDYVKKSDNSGSETDTFATPVSSESDDVPF
mgnify:CR=1 FL=1